MKLTNEEIIQFYDKLRKHNKQFSLKPVEEYKFYIEPFRGKHHYFIREFLNVTRFKFLCTAVGGWGLNRRTLDLFYYAEKRRIPFFIFEDGFVRSVHTWCANVNKKLRSGISFLVDTKGAYFDGNIQTDLEELLNTYEVPLQCQDYAKNIIRKLVSKRITKYNNQPLELDCILGKCSDKENVKRVLVIDQSYGDMSLIRGGITDAIFKQMIDDAVRENPDYEILFKVHPDTIAKKENSAFLQSLPQKVNILDVYVNPLVLLERVDKVYVATSQMGFEALMLGKEVHVYGMPFYAGWGLTCDKINCGRRTRNLNLYELFYIVYSNYIAPERNEYCDINEAIEYIVKERSKFLDI